jgi:hypothetical protein
VPGHHVVERLAAARRAGVEAIWDLSHYHRNQDPVRCARIAAEASLSVNGPGRLWLCPVNEPSLSTRQSLACRGTRRSTWRSQWPAWLAINIPMSAS